MFGRWTVGAKIRKNGKIYYRCTCECGTVKDVNKWTLLRGESKSCGCLRQESQSKRRSKDKTGAKVGKLTLVERLPNYKSKHTYYKCVCECGNECIVADHNLSKGHTQSCGCNTKIRLNNRKDYTGVKFGRLIVKEMLYNYGINNRTHCKCICDCGNECIVDAGSLISGKTKSCGCLEKESRYNRKHYKDLSNIIFGYVVPIKMLYIDNGGHAIWMCKCDCGNIIKTSSNNLLSGKTTSCGCRHYESNAIDLTGKKFGKLTAKYYIRGNGKTKRKWFCECECGNSTIVCTWDLIRENTLSCGCMKQSHMELYIENLLTENNIDFIQQCRFDNCRNVRSLPFDFYLPDYKVCIEYDGKQHFEPVDFFGGQKAFEQRKINDNMKTNYCLENGISLMRLPYTMSKIK